jgi:micrococcal nuclease
VRKLLLLLLATIFSVILFASPVLGEDKTYAVDKVIDIVDGDTFDVQLDLGFNIFYQARVRLNGINTPESRTKDIREKELGLIAKSFSAVWLESATSLTLIVEKREKFGRELGKILNEKNESLGDELIKAGLAREYHGEKRNGWFNDAPKTETTEENV